MWFLVQDKGLPSELEIVVFDLWALRIAQLGDKIASNRPESDSQSQFQVFNTLETDDSVTTDAERGRLKNDTRQRDRKLAGVPNLRDCLALCYLGILTLRLPFTPGDIYAWVTDGKLAYRRAIKLLPLAMRDRLPSTYHAILDPNTLFKYMRFYNTVTDLQISFSKDHGIQWPALNVPLLLYRYLKELALPLELYDATTRLANLLGYDFAPHHNGNKRIGIRHLPEAQFLGCFMVCIKLLYPLDDERRIPKSSSEPTTTGMDWDHWCTQMAASTALQPEEKEPFTTDELMKIQEKDVFSMPSDRLDQYLDFYADTFLDEAEVQRTRDVDDFRNALYNMFPIQSRGERHFPRHVSDGLTLQKQLDIVKEVHESMQPVSATPDEDDLLQSLRPGQEYQVWKKGQDVPERAKVLYEKAANLAGLSVDMLVLAVFFTEARIEQWRRRQMTAQHTEVGNESG